MSNVDDAPPNTLTPNQQAAIDAAAKYAGKTEDDEEYQHFVDPAGSRSEEAQVAHATSACMLLAAFLIGWTGHFVGNTIQNILARLWTTHSGECVPDLYSIVEGMQVWWKENSATGAEEHVDACIERIIRRSMYHLTLYVIAAGQRVTQQDIDDGQFQQSALGKRCCKRLIREVSWDDTLSAWVDDANKRQIRKALAA